MDIISLAGLLLGMLAILLGQVLEGGHLGSLLQPTAFMIVIGGTVGAVMLQSPWRAFRNGVAMARWVFFPSLPDQHALIAQVVAWSGIARKEGLLALESRIDDLPDPFVRKGLQLLVDGVDPEHIRQVLEVEISTWEADMKQATKVWEAAGGYAPTIGIIGAVMGLIHVMGNLADPGQLGSGIAVAFVATIYGVASANLVLLPIASKLKAIAMRQSLYREMLLEGILSIAEGENPRSIELKLQGFTG